MLRETRGAGGGPLTGHQLAHQVHEFLVYQLHCAVLHYATITPNDRDE